MNKAAVKGTIATIVFAVSYGYWFRTGQKLADWCSKKEDKAPSKKNLHDHLDIHTYHSSLFDKPVYVFELLDMNTGVTDIYPFDYDTMDGLVSAFIHGKEDREKHSAKDKS